jgi:hypothetical protein
LRNEQGFAGCTGRAAKLVRALAEFNADPWKTRTLYARLGQFCILRRPERLIFRHSIGSFVMSAKCLFLCVASSFLGVVGALAWTHGIPATPANAQGPQLRHYAVQRDPLEEFTPEERTNIAVYEQVNRSVVNITTTCCCSWMPSTKARARVRSWIATATS